MTASRRVPFHGFEPHDEVVITRRRLPHWGQMGVVYFVTFRLADSVPQSVLLQWRDERAIWLRWHPLPWRADEQREYEERFISRGRNGRMPVWVRVTCGTRACARKSNSACCNLTGNVTMLMHLY